MSEKVRSVLGSSDAIRAEYDYYATDPSATEMLTQLESINHLILEPFCGEGHIAKVLENHGHSVFSSDLINRGFGEVANVRDYKLRDNKLYLKDDLICDQNFDIVTNPPYKYAAEFTEYCLELLRPGCKLIQFLKVQFLETQKRKRLFRKYPLKTLHVSSSRLVAAKNGDFKNTKGSAVCYCWFVWEKGFSGNPIIKWFN